MKLFWSTFALALVVPTIVPRICLAQTPFDGTWRVNMSKSKTSGKPLVFSMLNGSYECSSCNPQIHVPADGKEHAVQADFFDSISVRLLDPTSIEIVTKNRGRVFYEQTDTVSADGQTLTIKMTEHSPDSKELSHLEITDTRVENGPSGSIPISGAWRRAKAKASESWLTSTYKSNGDEFSYTSPDGESYTAKWDGKDYPAKGGFAYNRVTLKRLGDRSFEETDKLDGEVVSVWKMTVSADGRTMTQVAKWPRTGQTYTYIAKKQ